jgi:hypothetical protein
MMYYIFACLSRNEIYTILFSSTVLMNCSFYFQITGNGLGVGFSVICAWRGVVGGSDRDGLYRTGLGGAVTMEWHGFLGGRYNVRVMVVGFPWGGLVLRHEYMWEITLGFGVYGVIGDAR